MVDPSHVLNADQRLKLMIGTLITTNEMQRDQIDGLQALLKERDELIAKLQTPSGSAASL